MTSGTRESDWSGSEGGLHIRRSAVGKTDFRSSVAVPQVPVFQQGSDPKHSQLRAYDFITDFNYPGDSNNQLTPLTDRRPAVRRPTASTARSQRIGVEAVRALLRQIVHSQLSSSVTYAQTIRCAGMRFRPRSSHDPGSQPAGMSHSGLRSSSAPDHHANNHADKSSGNTRVAQVVLRSGEGILR